MLSESDLNLLDAYLDDALSASEVQVLDARLSEEPETAAALDSLRKERQARVAAFASLTPEPAHADRFAEGVLSSVRRRQFGRRVMRAAQWVGSLAACLAVGFFVGWIGRGGRAGGTPGPVVAPAQTHDDAHLVIQVPGASDPGQYHVAVLDGKGRVLAVEHFSKLEDPRQIAAYIGQYRARREPAHDMSTVMGRSSGPGIPTLDSKRSPHGTPKTRPATQPAN